MAATAVVQLAGFRQRRGVETPPQGVSQRRFSCRCNPFSARGTRRRSYPRPASSQSGARAGRFRDDHRASRHQHRTNGEGQENSPGIQHGGRRGDSASGPKRMADFSRPRKIVQRATRSSVRLMSTPPRSGSFDQRLQPAGDCDSRKTPDRIAGYPGPRARSRAAILHPS